jgi:hypothetical protein
MEPDEEAAEITSPYSISLTSDDIMPDITVDDIVPDVEGEVADIPSEAYICVGDATYQASFAATAIDYSVTYENEDGTEISNDTYHYGDTVTTPEDPSKEDDENYTYTFAGWELVSGTALENGDTCTSNATYKAVFYTTPIQQTTQTQNTQPQTQVTYPQWSPAVSAQTETAPATGDNSNLLLWTVLMLGAFAGLVCAGSFYDKKRKDDQK